MYYYLIGSLKRRVANELKDSFSKHPIYSKVVPFIQNKYAFNQRPQYGIVIKGASANKIALSSDNYMGIVDSHVMLMYFGKPAFPIEWVREDQAAIQANNGVFPLQPGVYFIEILSVPKNVSDQGTFVIDPLLTVPQEPVLKFTSGIETEGQLQNIPVNGTLRMYENRRYLLKENTDYKVDYNTGKITFLTRFDPGAQVIATYRYVVPSIGPIQFAWNVADFKTLPGVVMAFGKRAQVGDKVAVVVYPDRVETARAFGGKWEVSFELDVIAQDPMQMEEMVDFALIDWWANKKPLLEYEGIETVDISMGGESEEPMDETGDIYSYTASMSIQLRADWELHIPMPLTMSNIIQVKPTPTGDQIPDPSDPTSSAGLISVGPNNLAYATLPIFAGRNNDFERIR